MWQIWLEREEGKEKEYMNRFVIDASVALKWQLKDEMETERALQMLTDFIKGDIDLLSPSFFAYEIVNAIYISVSRKRIPEKEGIGTIRDILSVGVKLVDFSELIEQTFKLAKIYNRSTYDCAYISLAEKEGCLLYTADKRLLNALDNKVKFIKWIGDY